MNQNRQSMKEQAPEIQKRFYDSAAWKRCRKEYMAKVGYICERCAKRGLIVPAKIVHHKEYITAQNITDPNILIDHDNLEALCLQCHNEEHDTPTWMTEKKESQREVKFEIDDSGKILDCSRPKKLFGPP